MNVCIVTGSRADYDRLYPVMCELRDRPDVTLLTVPIGSHFSQKHGMTVDQITDDGFAISGSAETPVTSDRRSGLTKSAALAAQILPDVFDRLNPDVVVVLGDRFELMAVATACVCQNIPLVHLCGGEVTEGAIDEQIRHMLTKAAHLHCAANETFASRILQMGEEEWRVRVTGSPALDTLASMDFISLAELGAQLDLDLTNSTALVTYHPTTLDSGDVSERIMAVLNAMNDYDLQYVITYPNADPGHEIIIEAIESFGKKNKDRVKVVENLGRTRYLSLLKHVAMVIGNSSSGVVEAASFNVPAVNIGSRQSGRVFGKNVIHADDSQENISHAIRAALEYDATSCENPYGDGHASERIVGFIADVFTARSRDEILRKRFVDRL